MSRFDTSSAKPDWIGSNTRKSGHFNRADHVWLVAKGIHDRHDQPTVPTCRFETVIAGAVEEEGIELVLRRPGKTIRRYPSVGRRDRSLVVMSSSSRRSSSGVATIL